jgi:hypothetical protein
MYRELNKEKDKKGRIVASYGIDDDDFYDDFYGGGKTPVGVKVNSYSALFYYLFLVTCLYFYLILY